MKRPELNRFSVFLSALLVCGFVLAACTAHPGRQAAQPKATGVLPPTGEVATLTYWEEEAADGDVLLDELAAEFMKANPAVKVVRVHYSYEELQTRLKGGDTPDLVRCISDCAGPFSQSGQFQPLDGLFGQAFLAQFFPGALTATTVGGRLWGIPDNYGNALMLIYNRDLVKEVPADTNAWIAQLKTLTDPAADRYGLVYFLDEPYWLLPWLGGFGGWPLDDADKPTLDSPAMVNALAFVQNLKVVARVVPPQADYDTAFDYFRRGLAAYLIDGEWSLDALRQTGIPFGVVPLPRVSATGLYPTPATTGRHWFLASHVHGSKLDIARSFITFMTSAYAQERWLDKARRLPSLQEVANTSPVIAADPILKGMMDQFSKGRGLPQAPVMRCVWSAMRPSLQAAMADQMTPAQAASAMQKDALVCAGSSGRTVQNTHMTKEDGRQ